MKRIILSLSVIFCSHSALAGSTDWQPSVGPGQRIVYAEIGETGGYKWNNQNECNEVVRRGYAIGVGVSGKVIYEGNKPGYNGDSISYSGIVTPDRDYKRQAPAVYNGKKKVAHGDSYTYWVK
ncbi:hypothetical protein [Escherichia coli]|uniref:hypothetical protein n=1 Tax=Escherichia coli TaxID=562 RepID=UPI00094483D2|nr:hypothetical protein [Escherichia coli]OKU66955.1 hypothetical protein AWP45_24380 [Escherichia coli]OKW44194.1 hypothetical protein AWP77_02300 [Escherichia coli]OKW59398.1 hypothetical protein AWP76_05865 [Escherichia coli]